MRSTLKGGPELAARLKALRVEFKGVGKEWGSHAVARMRPRVPSRTGRLRRSFRATASQRRAAVKAHFTAFFIDAGTAPHLITPRRRDALAWRDGGRTIFAKKVNHPRTRAQPFRAEAARRALHETAGADELIKAWNRAA